DLAARVHVDELTRLHTERGAVDALAINHDVTVHDLLTGLRGRAGEACANHKGVEAHLEQLDEVLTGETVGATRLVEDDAKLRLTDAVLGAQTLLLAQTNGVVTVGLAARAAVLSRGVGAHLEVLGRLRGGAEAGSPREAGRAAGA